MNSWEFKKKNPEKFKNIDDDILLRGVTAHKYLNCYIYNDKWFFEDYRNNFRIRKTDSGISGNGIYDNKENLSEFQSNYYNNPSEQTLNQFCGFLKSVLYAGNYLYE